MEPHRATTNKMLPDRSDIPLGHDAPYPTIMDKDQRTSSPLDFDELKGVAKFYLLATKVYRTA